jgi:SAM-dependent methyltransferase
MMVGAANAEVVQDIPHSSGPAVPADQAMERKMLARIKRSVAYVTIKEWKKAAARKVALPRYLGTELRCPVCGVHLRAFKPIWKSYLRHAREFGYVHSVSDIETLNLAAYSCPACDAADRERLYALYFDRVLPTLERTRRYRLVEFAPGPGRALQRKLAAHPSIEYRSADLMLQTVDDRLDITDMRTYADASVDFFLCSHVLEHVPDDHKAMRELHRILKPGGFGIVMVPLVHGLEETQEDPSVNTPELRWKYYGLGDHLRQYGKRDFLARLAAAGFQVDQLGLDYFGKESFHHAGIAEDSVLYVVRHG